jgi:hypothetical protein
MYFFCHYLEEKSKITPPIRPKTLPKITVKLLLLLFKGIKKSLQTSVS